MRRGGKEFGEWGGKKQWVREGLEVGGIGRQKLMDGISIRRGSVVESVLCKCSMSMHKSNFPSICSFPFEVLMYVCICLFL